MVYNFTPIDFHLLYFIAIIALLVAIYFTLVLVKVGYLKEVFSAFIMTVSIAVFPHYLQGIFDLKWEYFAYFLMLFSNLILLSIADTKHDQKLGFNSLVRYLGESLTVKLLKLIIAILLIGSFWCFQTIQLWLIFHSILTLILLFLSPKIESHLMHFLTDIILLFPLYYLC